MSSARLRELQVTDGGLPPLRMERNRAHEMKDASAGASLEPTVSVAHLAAAITTAASRDIREKECVCDRIYASQPNLLSSVLAQRLRGVSMPTIDVLLNILIVLYLAIEESGQVLAIISEADQERELQRFYRRRSVHRRVRERCTCPVDRANNRLQEREVLVRLCRRHPAAGRTHGPAE